ncbi:MAG: polysaccharide pyruvyl transferase CsaB [Gloeobacterales cyanobacterium]
MNTKQAVLCGYYGFGNGGDEALLATLLQMLPAQVTPIVLSNNPEKTAKTYGIRSINRWNSLDILRALRQSQAFIFGGGSLLQDATSLKSVLYYCGLIGLAQGMGLKTIAWAQGLGPLKTAFGQQLARRALSKCQGITVRDGGSAKILEQWKLPYSVTADPVWALESLAVPELADLPMPRVAVVVRTHSQFTEARIQTFIQALQDFQKATDLFVLLVPFHLPQDVALSKQIAEILGDKAQLLLIEEPRRLKGIFRGVDYTLAMRFHGVLMAASEGSVLWGLSYDPKVKQLLQDIQAPGCSLDQLPDPQTLCRIWLEHYANGLPLTEIQRASWADRAKINAAMLREVLS